MKRGRPRSQLSGERTDPCCGPTGVMATACLDRESDATREIHSGGCVSQRDAREGQAWPLRKSERFVVCAGQRDGQEGSSPSGARMRGAVSKSGGNSSLAGG